MQIVQALNMVIIVAIMRSMLDDLTMVFEDSLEHVFLLYLITWIVVVNKTTGNGIRNELTHCIVS